MKIETPTRPAAGVDVLIKPPKLYLISLVGGALLQWLWPLPLTLSPWLRLVGVLLIGIGLWLSLWGDREFKLRETAVNPDQPPTAMVTAGPYRFSRNPMYMALTLLQMGVALALLSPWLLLTLLPTLFVLQRGVIAREEQYLADRFGSEYETYRRQVRRWL